MPEVTLFVNNMTNKHIFVRNALETTLMQEIYLIYACVLQTFILM